MKTNELYELVAEIDNLNDQLDDAEEVEDAALFEILEQQFKAVAMQADEKLAATWSWLRNLEARGAMYQAEASRLYSAGRRCKKWHERLKRIVAEALSAGGEFRKWKDPNGPAGFAWRKSEGVSIVDERAIPDAWCKIVREPSLTEISKTIKEGGTVPGAFLEKRMNLQVK